MTAFQVLWHTRLRVIIDDETPMMVPEQNTPDDDGQPPFDLTEAAEFLSLFANSKRLEVLITILTHECNVKDLSQRVGLSSSALSQHLYILRMANVVERRREIREVFYSSRSEAVAKVLKTLEEIYLPSNPPTRDR